MMGEHNVQNALAVVAVAQELGVSDQALAKALRDFQGVKRRFTCVGEVQGVTIIDDYAHHPVEIETTLKASRQASAGKVIAILQPHRYTRVKALFDDFVQSVRGADAVILAPIYAAGEKPLEGISSDTLFTAMKKAGVNAFQIEDPKELPSLLSAIAHSGDLVVCMGAGSITYWAAALPLQLEGVLFAPPPLPANSITLKPHVTAGSVA
jgi:UDP-N-acetylmuramate--alanine ligase